MFQIDTEHLKLQIEVVPVETLRLHEEVIPAQAEELVLEFRNWANLQNPIIVDENLMVLDGHHRAFVFRKLGFQNILVCKIDYFHASVQLRYWFRRLGPFGAIDPLKRLIEEMNGRLESVDDGEALRRKLEENRFQCGIQHGRFFGCVDFQEAVAHDAVSAYDCVETLQVHLLQTGKRIDYVPCQSVRGGMSCDGLRPDDLIIWTPQISKDMVVDAVMKEKRFAPKSTRHLIPSRPIHVNLPIRLFREDLPLEAINAKLVAMLKSKDIKRFGPGQILGGRYYQEELYVFVDR